MKGLTILDRAVIEKIRKADEVAISINYGTRDELTLYLRGDGPHDIAIAAQAVLNKSYKTTKDHGTTE